ncbi:hypothetical protein H2203_008955 [Taxawa tesnikishii (nom. ined.)]|nr:hypothetical protein H2203_008955 [Dothideales sp. JES 119]
MCAINTTNINTSLSALNITVPGNTPLTPPPSPPLAATTPATTNAASTAAIPTVVITDTSTNVSTITHVGNAPPSHRLTPPRSRASGTKEADPGAPRPDLGRFETLPVALPPPPVDAAGRRGAVDVGRVGRPSGLSGEV